MRYISWLQCQGIYVNKLQSAFPEDLSKLFPCPIMFLEILFEPFASIPDQCPYSGSDEHCPDNSHVSSKLLVLRTRISQTLIYTGRKIYDVDDNMACR